MKIDDGRSEELGLPRRGLTYFRGSAAIDILKNKHKSGPWTPTARSTWAGVRIILGPCKSEPNSTSILIFVDLSHLGREVHEINK